MGLFKRRSKDLFRLPEPPPGPGLPPGTGPPVRPSPPSLPEPFSQPAQPFRMPVEDVFVITARGLVATGRIEAGMVAVGSQVTVERGGVALRTTEVTGVEKFRKRTRSAVAGENVGLLLRGLQRGDVASGDVLRGSLP